MPPNSQQWQAWDVPTLNVCCGCGRGTLRLVDSADPNPFAARDRLRRAETAALTPGGATGADVAAPGIVLRGARRQSRGVRPFLAPPPAPPGCQSQPER